MPYEVTSPDDFLAVVAAAAPGVVDAVTRKQISDEAAVKHLRGRSWQGQAIRDLGVEIEVVQLPDDVVASISAAQRRQYR